LVLVEETVAHMVQRFFFDGRQYALIEVVNQPLNQRKQPMPDSTLNELLEFIESEELVLLAYDHIQESPEPAIWN